MIKIANAPCSWGVLEFDLEGQTAGYAQVLDEMRDTGYSGTELGDWGFMPTDAVQLKHEVEARGLTMLAAFVPVNLSDRAAHGAGEEAALRTAHLLANAACAPPSERGETALTPCPRLFLHSKNIGAGVSRTTGCPRPC